MELKALLIVLFVAIFMVTCVEPGDANPRRMSLKSVANETKKKLVRSQSKGASISGTRSQPNTITSSRGGLGSLGSLTSNLADQVELIEDARTKMSWVANNDQCPSEAGTRECKESFAAFKKIDRTLRGSCADATKAECHRSAFARSSEPPACSFYVGTQWTVIANCIPAA